MGGVFGAGIVAVGTSVFVIVGLGVNVGLDVAVFVGVFVGAGTLVDVGVVV